MSCEQKLQLDYENGTKFRDWNCADNTVAITDLTTSETYLNMTFINSLAAEEGSYWLGFKCKFLCLIDTRVREQTHNLID